VVDATPPVAIFKATFGFHLINAVSTVNGLQDDGRKNRNHYPPFHTSRFAVETRQRTDSDNSITRFHNERERR
jgi:hypothetical protein